MVGMEFSDCLNKLLKQHNAIKTASKNVIEILETWTEHHEFEQLIELKEQVILLSKLYNKHYSQVEKIIIPLLKEMYSTNEDITKYVHTEHSYLQNQFDYLVRMIVVNPDHPTLDIVQDLSNLLNQQLEHLFIEEQGLYPLIQNYLNRIKNKQKTALN